MNASALRYLSCVAAIALAAPAMAVAQQRNFDLPAQPANKSIPEFARQAGIQIVAPGADLRGMRTPGLKGRYDVREALAIMLRGQSLAIAADDGGTITLSSVARKTPAPRPGVRRISAVTPSPIVYAQAGPVERSASPQNIQTEPGAEADERPAADATIVVTGSRIVRNGYEAPTPVTVATTENLLKAAPTGLANGLVQLPQFSGSLTESNQFNNIPTAVRSGTTLALRGLGSIRTLILQDGFRAPPTDPTGSVNVDIIPQALIERVDIVTSGASAAYGSDAVTGVVNFITKKKFTGWKVDLQGGISNYNDNENYRASVTWGSPIGDRAHIVLSAMRYESEGFRKIDRPYLFNGAQAVGSVPGSLSPPGSAANPLIDIIDAKQSYFTPGGSIARVGSYPGSYAGLVFFQNATYRQVNPGTPTGTFGVFTGVSDFTTFADGGTLGTPQSTTQGFGRLSYDVADDITMYVQGSLTKTKLDSEAYAPFLFPGGLPIYSENPFIPASLHIPALDFGPDPAFYVSKLMEYGPHGGGRNRDTNYTVRAGFDGNNAGFDWHIAYQHARSISKVSAPNAIDNLRTNAALDAVRDPQGNIVCRVTLNPDAAIRARYAGCVPLNPFGPNSESPEALRYITGTTAHARSEIGFDAISANFSRKIVDLWAGPLSLAAGAEYRELSLKVTSDSDPSIPQDLTGLRGGIPTASRHVQGDQGESQGSYNIKEAFAEIDLPLLKDASFAKSLDLNAAIRFTDYSTSGNVKTWKIGGSWIPFDGLRFRATRSRDIRAPSVYELFQGTTNAQLQFVDPHTNQTKSVPVVSGGNRNLKPEIGDALSFGFVAAPAFAPNFRFSVDYYKLDIKDAIQTTDYILLLNECEASNGTAPACDRITRPLPFSDRSPANTATGLQVGPENIGKLAIRGLDVDASYVTEVGEGRLNVRLIGNLVFSLKRQSASTLPVVQYAGYTGNGFEDTAPKIRGNLQVNYDIGKVGIFVQERMIGKLKRGPSQVWAEPSLPAVFYTDATLTYRLGQDDKQQVFFTVNNLFNKKAPIYSIQQPAGLDAATLVGVYDVVGRMFTAGVRLSF